MAMPAPHREYPSRLGTRRNEAQACPCLLATLNDTIACLIVGFESHGLLQLCRSDSEHADAVSGFL
jgi:hypothetical protein